MNTTISNLQELIPQVQESLEELKRLLGEVQGDERPKYKLVVTYDGEKIEKKRASDTFVSVIEKIGIERVEDLKIIAVGSTRNRSVSLPLIAPYRDTHPQRRSDPYFIAMGSNTPQKAKWLKEIAERLNLNMEVEVKNERRKPNPL